MNIKSLLLGSAAALLAVSGARAADMVEVAPEAEPMEYVRICDTYGAGFYYIPGTETCLRVGGFMRYDIGFGNDFRYGDSRVTAGPLADAWWVGDASDYGWEKNFVTSIQLDARTETELGTLRGFADIRFSVGNDGKYESGVGFDAAYISLGGLSLGYMGNAFDYGFSDIEQDLLGGATTHAIAYTFDAGNGFSAAISLDDDGDVIKGSGAWESGKTTLPKYDDKSGADFIPNVSANVQYTSSAFSAGLYGAYDNDTEEFAIKGIVDVNVTEADKILLGAYWTTGPNYSVSNDKDLYTVATAATGTFDPYLYRSSIGLYGKWSVQAAYKHTFSDRLWASITGVYVDDVGHVKDRFKDDGYDAADWAGKANFWRVGTTVGYTIVPGFDTKLSLNYNKFGGRLVKNLDSLVTGDDKLGSGYVDGFIRFQRNF